MRTPRVERELALVRDKHPDAMAVDEAGGTIGLIIPSFPLPSGFTAPSATIAVRIPSLYPSEKLDLFWLDPAIARTDGTALPNVMGREIDVAGRRWTQISWHDNGPHDPGRISVMGFVRSIDRWFDEQVGAS